MRKVAVLCCVALAACAGGRVGNPDAGASGDAEVFPDSQPTKPFGEPCTDNKQCDSGLCILVGTSGQCTQLCGDCPDGYGCLGVEGIAIEGTVSFVCVPEGNQLCTTCASDSECTLIGMDKCVTYPDGDKACARDCSSVSCPVGYSCDTVAISGVNYQQCMADSGACDCSAANPGAMQPCNIMTPWNVCVGQQTCSGANGWGTCAPPSANDDPDASFVDSNCDGIDGDRSRAIFVSPAGVNTSTCGLDYSDPCQTIAFAISRATATTRPHIYLQAGSYTTSLLTMSNGISIFGGYNFNWRRRPYSETGHAATITSGTTAVRFNAITQPTWLDNVIVRSADATTTGASSIGILITGSTLVELRGVLVEPGAGAAGSAGTDGSAGTGGGDGGIGTAGCEDSGVGCADCSRPPGGTGGSSACGREGGIGGLPGHPDQTPNGFGDWGGDGAIAGACPGGQGCGGIGAQCSGSRSCDGQMGFAGSNGGAGAHGTPGASFGSFSGTTYVAANGTVGFTGGAGNGGGGGGGGGGGDANCNSFGSSGGGGGGGGCGGTRGFGGTGGGGSFGVIALDSEVTISGGQIKGGSGGTGGRGGIGGGGGPGGSGGLGGPYSTNSEQDDGGDGAPGGAGGSGGRGGDGGGGGGGPSIAVVCLGSSSTGVTINAATLTAGTGGSGGTSNAPGASGTSAMTRGCL